MTIEAVRVATTLEDSVVSIYMQYDYIDSFTMELSDLAARPYISYAIHLNNEFHFTLVLTFANDKKIGIQSKYQSLIRYYMRCINANQDVLESDIYLLFPELFI